MARIEGVDYEAMPGQANEMRGHGRQLNTELSKVYSSVEEMHNSWYGKRYNELVKAFNEMIPQLNDMLELVVAEIPYTLETIANNYSQADRGQNVTTASQENPNKLSNLAIYNDVGMKFLTNNVNAIQQSISTNFNNAKDQLDRIEVVYGKVQWRSEAAEAFKTRFTKLKRDIETSFENINTEFTKLMEQTQQDIDNAEKANTVN